MSNLKYTVYILKCADKSYHIGITRNLSKRVALHESGQNPMSPTLHKRPLKLAFSADFKKINEALVFEKYLNTISDETLKNLIENEIEKLHKKAFELSTSPTIVTETIQEKTITLPALYLGNIFYFKLIAQYSTVYINPKALYEKQTFRNRSEILGANGIQSLTIPIIRPNGKATIMANALLSTDEDWRKNHIRAITSAYKKAPYFEFYALEIFSIINQKNTNLYDLNFKLVEHLAAALDLETEIKCSLKDDNQIAENLNELVIPKLKSTEGFKTYTQTFQDRFDFEPNLSILDLLFNVGPAAKSYLLN
ncbi:WbqC family protein [Crocinitomix catalasitica]|uniref:WbqC family protein n=1 Tax=Crocinitomix catalasitica TaxID=184607 RepID=UPI000907779A|nr:WbqC family protein [Crocinitomix catalasitica]